MSTAILSEDTKEKINTEIADDDPNLVILHGNKFLLNFSLYKKDKPQEAFSINNSIIDYFEITESLDSVFQTITLVIDSNFGSTQSTSTRTEKETENLATNTSTIMKALKSSANPSYDFDRPGEDYCKVMFTDATKIEGITNTTLINGDFVIINVKETPIDNATSTNSSIMLAMIPVAQWKLMTTYPQWTTGFEYEYGVKTHGKKTGKCISELLNLCGLKLDNKSEVENCGPMINYTSMVNNSCLETLGEIIRYHYESIPDDPVVFKYVQQNDLFSVTSLSTIFAYDQDGDDIGSYPNIFIHKTMGDEDYKMHAADRTSSRHAVGIDILQPTITRATPDVSPTMYVTRRQNTFKFLPFEYDHKTLIETIQGRPYIEKSSIEGKLNRASLQTETIDPTYEEQFSSVLKIEFSPNYRTNQLETRSDIIKRILAANMGVSFTIPGGSYLFSGRKMFVQLYDTTNPETIYEKNLVGVYLVTGTKHTISLINKSYMTFVTGRKFQRKPITPKEEKLP